MATFYVPIEIDGDEYEVPIDAVDEASAIQGLSTALSDGSLDPQTIIQAQAQQVTDPRGPDTSAPVMGPVGAANGVTVRDVKDFAAGLPVGMSNLYHDANLFAIDAAMAGLDALPVDGEGLREAQTGLLTHRRNIKQQKINREAEMDAAFIKTFDAAPNDAGKMVGEILPWFILPQYSSRYLGAVIEQGALGALGGGIASPDAKNFQDRIGDMTAGSLMGVGATSILNAPGGVLKAFGRRWLKKIESEAARAKEGLQTRIREMTGNPEFSFSAAQISGDPSLQGLEFRTRGIDTKEQQNKNIETLWSYFNRRADELSKAGRSGEEVVTDLHKTLQQLDDELRTKASIEYTTNVNALLDKWGDDVFLDGNAYLSSLKEMAGELVDPRRFGKRGLPSGLKRHMEFVDLKVNPYKAVEAVDEKGMIHLVDRRTGQVVEKFKGRDAKKRAYTQVKQRNTAEGGLTADDTLEVVKGHNALIGGETKLFEGVEAGSSRNIGEKLKSSLLGSLETRGGGAYEDMKKVTSAYRAHMEEIAKLDESVLGRIFGSNTDLSNTPAVLDKLMASSPKGMSQVREVLERHNPGLLDDLKAEAMRRVVQRSVDPAMPSSLSALDPSALARNLSGKGGEVIGEHGLGLFSAAEQAEIKDAAEAVRVLNETYQRLYVKDPASSLGDLAINVISRSPEFMARFITRVTFTSQSLERALLDPQRRQWLRTLVQKPPHSAPGRLAIAGLMMHLGEVEAQNNEDRRNAALIQRLQQGEQEQ